jgi:hypothetical protein
VVRESEKKNAARKIQKTVVKMAAVAAIVSEVARGKSFDKGWPLSLRARNCNPQKVWPRCVWCVFFFIQ